jgi:hypothetical protein
LVQLRWAGIACEHIDLVAHPSRQGRAAGGDRCDSLRSLERFPRSTCLEHFGDSSGHDIDRQGYAADVVADIA